LRQIGTKAVVAAQKEEGSKQLVAEPSDSEGR